MGHAKAGPHAGQPVTANVATGSNQVLISIVKLCVTGAMER